MRYTATENFAKIPVASPATIVQNTNFFLGGTSASCAKNTGGGVTLTTNTATNALAVLNPFAGSAFKDTVWSSNSELQFETTVKTPASISSLFIAAGVSNEPLGLTAISSEDLTKVDLAFVYEPSVSANWILMTVGADGSSHLVTTRIPVVASTAYRLTIKLDALRNVFFYVNDLPANFNPLPIFPADKVAQPYVGCRGNAQSLSVAGVTLSQNI